MQETLEAAPPMVPGLATIVIPCYKGARFLAEAIESCLRQTYRDIEVIVVDDASPDDCAAIGDDYARRDPRVRVIRREANGGVSRAFNTGFRAARGEYFTRLAQDDLFGEDAVAFMLEHLKDHPADGLVYCDFQAIDERGAVVGQRPVPGPSEVLADANRLGGCVMWRRSVWEEVGGFDPDFDTAEDFEYWLRISKRFPIAKREGAAPFFVRLHDDRGTNLFEVRQELAHWRARMLYCRGGGEARRMSSRCYAEVATIHLFRGRFVEAIRYAAVSAAYWPFTWKSYRVAIRTLYEVGRRGADRLSRGRREPSGAA